MYHDTDHTPDLNNKISLSHQVKCKISVYLLLHALTATQAERRQKDVKHLYIYTKIIIADVLLLQSCQTLTVFMAYFRAFRSSWQVISVTLHQTCAILTSNRICWKTRFTQTCTGLIMFSQSTSGQACTDLTVAVWVLFF